MKADRQRDEMTKGSLKTCSTCRTAKPLSEFWGSGSRHDGFSNRCTTCHKARLVELDIARGKRVVASKVCRVCQTEKPCYDFRHSVSSNDGLSSWCFACSKNTLEPLEMVCNKCGKAKDAKSFVADSKRPNGRRPTCKTCHHSTTRNWYKLNPTWQIERRANLRAETLDAYGNRCNCCGESTPEFLSVDHINNDGAAHRREAKLSGGSRFYEWLKKHGFPKDRFQLLCYNCNFAKGRYGECPHVKIRKLSAA